MSAKEDNIQSSITSLHEKVDTIIDHVHTIDVTLVKQEANLERHMERSDNLEAQHEILKNQIIPIVDRDRALKYIFSATSGVLVLLNIAYIIYRFRHSPS